MKSFLFFFLLVLLGCKESLNKVGSKKGEIIPSIDLQMMDSVSFLNTRSFDQNKSIVLILFDPGCPHCQHETKSVLSDIKKFRNTEICFISISTLSEVRVFQQQFKMYDYENVHLGIDTGFAYISQFGVNMVPHNSVYSQDKKLVAVYPFAVDSKELLSVLK